MSGKKKQSKVSLEIDVVIEHPEDVAIEYVINEMDYDFFPDDTDNARFVDQEITNFTVTE